MFWGRKADEDEDAANHQIVPCWISTQSNMDTHELMIKLKP